jgi:hypothetical protein
MAPIGLGRLIDELFNYDQQLADFTTPAILGDDDTSFNASFSRVFKFLAPGGRPLGLPDRPFSKRLCAGGLPKPTS